MMALCIDISQVYTQATPAIALRRVRDEVHDPST